MALFNFGKKKEEKKVSACCCGDSKPKAEETVGCCCGKPVEGICCIQVLGAGCKSCHQQYENVVAAVKNLDLETTVEYITDMEKIMTFGVLQMPAIVVNNKVVSAGRVLKTSEVEKLLRG